VQIARSRALRESKLRDQQENDERENGEERNKTQLSSHKAPEVICPEDGQKTDECKAHDL
jgi:hypothetical protein